MADTTLQVLIDKLTELKVSFLDASINADPVILDQSLQGRLSRMDTMQQQQLACNLYRMRQEELKLQTAINRFHDGIYGICCKCGEQIDKHRLRVLIWQPHFVAIVFRKKCNANEIHEI